MNRNIDATFPTGFTRWMLHNFIVQEFMHNRIVNCEYPNHGCRMVGNPLKSVFFQSKIHPKKAIGVCSHKNPSISRFYLWCDTFILFCFGARLRASSRVFFGVYSQKPRHGPESSQFSCVSPSRRSNSSAG